MREGQIVRHVCGAPCKIMRFTFDGNRAEVEYASGRMEDVGLGNLREPLPYTAASFEQMRSK